MNARAQFINYRQVMEDRRNVEWCGSEALEAWSSKAMGMTARLAGILTLLNDPAARMIESHEFFCAQQLMEEYFIPHMHYAFCGERSLSPAAEAVLKAMPDFMTRSCQCALQSQLWDRLRGKSLFKQDGGKELFSKALAELAAAHLIRPANVVPAATGRPISGAWEVHPSVLANVPALQPKRTGYELNKYFPDYDAPMKSVEQILEEQQWEKEAEEYNGLPF